MTLSIERIETGKRLSQAVVAGEWIFLAGQVAPDPSQPVAGQTRQVLAEVDRLLAAAGSSRSRLVSVTIYLADMADFASMNEVWDEWIPQDAKPARATVEARLATPAYRVEVQALAVRG